MKHTIIVLLIILSNLPGYSQEYVQSEMPPDFPIGEAAFTEWDKIPYLRMGVRAYMPSTYDRDGNNRGADGGHFLYQENDSFNVAMDVNGPGVLYFKRTNHFHGSPWHYEVDNRDLIVKETATDQPIGAKSNLDYTHFIPEELFPHPLVWTWSTTKGADLMWRPIPFNQRMRIAYSRTFYGTGYYIFHKFPYDPAKDQAQPPLSAPDPKAIHVLESAGQDQTLLLENKEIHQGTFTLNPYSEHTLDLGEGPQMIRGIQFRLPRSAAQDFGKCRIKATWDHRWHPSIDAPVDLFYGTGLLYNPGNKEYLVKGLPVVIRYSADSVYLNCYWPMPFFEHARISIEEKNGNSFAGISYRITSIPYTDPINHVAYFHATYTDHENPVPGQDLTFLDTRQVEGGGEWSGQFMGMSWIFSEDGVGWTLEGDPKIYLDDSRTPCGQGTGTEEWGGGGDYWGGEQMTIPLAGHPTGKTFMDAENKLDEINSAYRFLISDYFPFGRRAVINLEHGGMNSHPEHYSGVTYWYGIDAASLILTDQLSVFHQDDRRNHAYSSPSDETPYALVSRYDLGPDHDYPGWSQPNLYRESIAANMYYPAEMDTVVNMTGSAQFKIAIHPENHGLLLRRKFDYRYPNQEARIYVKTPDDDNWTFAGNWYSAGSNTIVHSRPQGRSFTEAELAPTEHHIFTSNRRWKEDEFLVSGLLSKGLSELEIRIEFVPNNWELFPGHPYPAPPKWSASRYWVYSYVMPFLQQDISKGGDRKKYHKTFEEIYQQN